MARTVPVQRYRRALEGLLGIPATEGNTVEVLRNGDEIFPAMLGAIRGSARTIDLATYIYWTGDIAEEFADALTDRASSGVRVRVLLDAVGAAPMKRELIQRMTGAGAQVEWFRQPRRTRLGDLNDRTHRKVLICDEEVGFTGGVGIAESWCGDARNPDEWRDTHVRVVGPAVDGLRAAFVSNWAETGRVLFDAHDRFPEQPQAGRSVVQVVQSASQTGWTELETTMCALLLLAQERVHITSAYFVPDDRIVGLLRGASQRGVSVKVLVPGDHADKRVVQIAGEEKYAPLLAAGVEIYRYAPTMLHAKVVTVDGTVATVGSANFDQRSMGTNEEANIVVFDEATTAVLDDHFAEDLRRSERVDPAEWEQRGLGQRVAETLTKPFDGQL
jgi:cardiolipin synthase A/B